MKPKALLIALTILNGWVGLFEEVRVLITSRGHPPPHTYHVGWVVFGMDRRNISFASTRADSRSPSVAMFLPYWKIMRTSAFLQVNLSRNSRPYFLATDEV
jgi:hypothetical protein